MKKIFLEGLPKKIRKGKEVVDWKNSIGYKVHFIYEDIEDDIEIIDYIPENQPKIKIKYKNNYEIITTNTIKHCKLGRIINKRTIDFKLSVGETIVDEKRDLIIIDREYRINERGQKRKWYKYRCMKCGAELWIVEDSLLNLRNGCSCCYGRTTIKGINDIGITHPWVIPLLKNKEDAYSHTYSSNKKIWVKCPDCGHEKLISVYILTRYGFNCSKCSDGIKYPNKFMSNLLEQLNIEFETEYSPEWISPKRYDFYIPSKNLIIEMDGGLGHGNKVLKEDKRTLDQTIEDDIYKDNMAKEHGLQVIRIDCNYDKLENRFEYIKENIIKKLAIILKLEKIDWRICDDFGCSNLLKEVCEYKRNNPELTTIEIGQLVGYNRHTIREWLKIGNKIGLCKYNPKKEKEKNMVKIHNIRNKKVKCLNDGLVFNSIAEASRYYSIHASSISEVCIGKRKTAGKRSFEYI